MMSRFYSIPSYLLDAEDRRKITMLKSLQKSVRTRDNTIRFVARQGSLIRSAIIFYCSGNAWYISENNGYYESRWYSLTNDVVHERAIRMLDKLSEHDIAVAIEQYRTRGYR